MTEKTTTGKTSHKAHKKGAEKPGPEEKKLIELKAALEESEKKWQETQDKYLRLSAEFDNYRKRTIKEKMDLIKLAGEEILLQVLPVMDDFERAMVSIHTSQDLEAMKAGVELIYGKFKDFLSGRGVKEIDSMFKDFDTDVHEAVTKIPVTEKKLQGKVVDVIEKGYMLHDKVIRFSKVVVGE